jgi:hypothetical protein
MSFEILDYKLLKPQKTVDTHNTHSKNFFDSLIFVGTRMSVPDSSRTGVVLAVARGGAERPSQARGSSVPLCEPTRRVVRTAGNNSANLSARGHAGFFAPCPKTPIQDPGEES